MAKHSFRPHHIPKFSRILFKALGNPLLVYFAVAGNVLTFSAAYVFYYFEAHVNNTVSHYWDAIWWALCTVSTVGYGDIVPVTVPGRIVGIFLIIVGVSFFLGSMAFLVSAVSASLVEEKQEIQNVRTCSRRDDSDSRLN